MRFVLIDRIVALEPGVRAVAVKTFPAEENLFEDHFPGFPVVPGTLLTEAMGQTGGWLLAATHGFSRWPLLNMIASAKFRRFVRPGEEIVLEAVVASAREESFEVRAQAAVAGSRVADARLFFHGFSPATLPGEPASFEAWARETFQQLGGESLLAGGNGGR